MKTVLRIICMMVAVSFLLGIGTMSSCKHEPIEPIPMPPDTTDNPPDTTGNPGDTTGVPCDTNVVYFNTQVLPILVSNCAVPGLGCHDVESEEHDVILTDYESLMESDVVEPFRLDNSDLFEKITEDDPEDRMPPPPRASLSQDQISLIATWILQGAENTECDVDAGNCDTVNVSFANDILPVIATNCQGCHSGASPLAGIRLEDYSTISAVAETGQLYGVIERLPGFPSMPFGQPKLPECTIDRIKSWIDAGMPNN